MDTLDNEKFIFDLYKKVSSHKIKYFGRFFSCLKIEILTKNFLFSNSWINSSSKSDPPPDFHNDKHKVMLEVMRIDDCVNEINDKKIDNTFAKSNKLARRLFGNDYKKTVDGYFFSIPNTNDSDEFNFKGYLSNFKKVLLNHSNKIENYRENYPKCKTTIFLICDESNSYVQVSDEKDLNKKEEVNVNLNNFKVHYCFWDSNFIEIIKKCNADFVIWWGYNKTIFVNNKKIKYPEVCIYDVKYFKEKGYEYNHELMFKINENHGNNKSKEGDFIAVVKK